jgi:hypothetical protein
MPIAIKLKQINRYRIQLASALMQLHVLGLGIVLDKIFCNFGFAIGERYPCQSSSSSTTTHTRQQRQQQHHLCSSNHLHDKATTNHRMWHTHTEELCCTARRWPSGRRQKRVAERKRPQVHAALPRCEALSSTYDNTWPFGQPTSRKAPTSREILANTSLSEIGWLCRVAN